MVSLTRVSATVAAPEGLAAFMAAVRAQESSGRYNAGGGGAYQIQQGNWDAWSRAAGFSSWAGHAPSAAPPAIQDAVASHAFLGYYYGAARQSWRNVAKAWNGGPRAISRPIPNPALGQGATTDTYADQVMIRMAHQPAGAGLQAAGIDAATATFSAGASQVGHVSCYFKAPKLGIPIPGVPDIGGFCLDKPVFLILAMVGLSVFVVGGVLVAVSAGAPGATQVANRLPGPVGRAAKVVAA